MPRCEGRRSSKSPTIALLTISMESVSRHALQLTVRCSHDNFGLLEQGFLQIVKSHCDRLKTHFLRSNCARCQHLHLFALSLVLQLCTCWSSTFHRALPFLPWNVALSRLAIKSRDSILPGINSRRQLVPKGPIHMRPR